jgi:sialidase-1
LSLRACLSAYISATVFASTMVCVSVAPAETATTTVFASGGDGYHTFRIPVIVKALNGDLLAFAEGRRNGEGDAGNIDIVLKRSVDGGRTWGSIQLVQDEWDDSTSDVAIGNPCVVVDRLDPEHRGRIWLAFLRNNRRVFVTYSDDHGATWSPRDEITSTAKNSDWGWYATGPGHGIQLTRGDRAGRLIIPSDHQPADGNGWGAHVLYSDDYGQSWRLGAVDTHPNSGSVHPNENTAVELTDGRLYVNARDQNGSDPASRLVAYSSDGGLSYDAPFVAEPAITGPVVQGSVVRLMARDAGDPCDALIYSGPGDSKRRRDLTIWVSLNEGRTWNVETVLHPGPAAYSDLVSLGEAHLGVLYEAGDNLYEQILFAPLDLSYLADHAASDAGENAHQGGLVDPKPF